MYATHSILFFNMFKNMDLISKVKVKIQYWLRHFCPSLSDTDQMEMRDELKMLRDKISRLSGELSEIKQRLDALSNDVSKEPTEDFARKSDKRTQFVDRQNDNSKTEHLRGEFLTIVNGLSEEIKKNVYTFFPHLADKSVPLSEILRNYDVEDFYADVRERVNNHKSENIEELKNLAHLVCEYYCQKTGCQLIEPTIGEKFNEEVCIEKDSTISFGKITKVLLFGIRNADGSVRNRAMVSLEK